MTTGTQFSSQFNRIKGLSERRRLPRLGKIRLGFKLIKKTEKGEREYPAELPFFLLPSDVAKAYGGKVTVERAQELGVTRKDVLSFIAANTYRLAEDIEIMLPINDIGAVFPNAYKWYGNSRGVKCVGDGERAMRYDEGKKCMVEMECPCENLKTEQNPKGECTQRGHLSVLVPRVTMSGIYQIDLGSYHSIVDINSGIAYVEALIGRFALVPLTLRRVPMQTHHDGQKQTHYTIQLLSNVTLEQLSVLRADNQRILTHSQHLLLPPDDTNPAMDKEGEAVFASQEPEPEKPEEEGPEKSTAKQEPDKNAVRESVLAVMKARLAAANTLPELVAAWKQIGEELKEKKLALTADESTALTRIKDTRKREIEEQEKKEQEKNLQELIARAEKQLAEAADLDTLEHIWMTIEPMLDGEEKVKLMRIKDRRASELRGGA
ncbi:MAG: hypothetical protein K8I29_19705 [Alphaproteobacteria bacterium]|uniref:Uncharacterized protein n=1 Tax=Candidatus Nitrobium versatile TaxID=2884831 RepID=A0A953M3S6_9BACT|nr:hypothetical protein [Candidatus Nitrobium versatile]